MGHVLSGRSNWIPGQQFFYSCVASSLFARKIVIVVFSQRDIATAYDEGYAYFIVGEILGALKKGSSSNPFTAVAAGLDHASRAWIAFVPVKHSSSILVP